MILEEKGVILNIPDDMRWEKFDEEDFYRNISHLGLKAVDFVFYGHKKLSFLKSKIMFPILKKAYMMRTLESAKSKK